MQTQFHTPSFGDEIFDLGDVDVDVSSTSSTSETGVVQTSAGATYISQHHIYSPPPQFTIEQSRRMRAMDQALDAEAFNISNSTASIHTATHTITSSAPTTMAARKQLTPVDTNEPTKPLSPYALFFRDTVSTIKQQNPNCSFQDLTRIVATMWEVLDEAQKAQYSRRNEEARNEYQRQLRVYQQQQAAQAAVAVELTGTHHLQIATPPLQTKPAVFTITRTNLDGTAASVNTITLGSNVVHAHTFGSGGGGSASGSESNLSIQQQTQPQPQAISTAQFYQQQTTTCITPPAQAKVHVQLQPQFYAQEERVVANPVANAASEQMQMVIEAGSAQKCTRDGCTKRAIINPDWEDEYCSNECVVMHCRNVFSTWIRTNGEMGE